MEHTIDRSEEIAAIKARYAGIHPPPQEAYQEAAALWQVDCNDCGVVLHPCEVVTIETQACRAEIRLHQTGECYWLRSTSFTLPNSGSGSAVSVWSTEAFTSRDAARDASIDRLISHLEGHKPRQEDDKARMGLIRKLKEERNEQLALF